MSRPRTALLLPAALLALPALASRPNPSDMAKDARQTLARTSPALLNDPTTRARCNAYLDGMSVAVCSGWGSWQNQAFLAGVMINGPTASGGTIIGPPVYSEVNAKAPPGWNCSQAIAAGFNLSFTTWASSVNVPSLPWYPVFCCQAAALPPALPNTPCFLNTLSSRTAEMAKPALKASMVKQLSGAAQGDPLAQALVDAMAGAIEQAFKAWIVTTQVTGVLGTGPVPTAATFPPRSGPVVAGIGNMKPGGFK